MRWLALTCMFVTACSTTTAAAPTPAPTALPAAAPAPAANSLVIDPSNSKASYHAHEQLVGRRLPSEEDGLTLEIVFAANRSG